MNDHNNLVICTKDVPTQFLGIDSPSGGHPIWNKELSRSYHFCICQIDDMIKYCKIATPDLMGSLIILDFVQGKIIKIIS